MRQLRRGFTRREALLGTAVMAVLALGIFNVFRTTNRQTSQAAWTSAAQRELRTGLKRIHDELAKGAVYTRISPSTVEMLDPTSGAPYTGTVAGEEAFRETHFALVVNSTDQTDDTDVHAAGGTTILLQWSQSIPRREGFAADAGGAAAACELRLEDDTLVLQRDQTHTFGTETIPGILQELVHNVVSVRVWANDREDPNEPLVGSEVTLDITVEHPNTEVFTNARIRQTLTARVPVGNLEMP